MPKLTQINRDETRLISNQALLALAKVSEELGISVAYKGGSFSGTYCMLKFAFSVISENGDVETPEARAFKELATIYNLKPDDLYRTIRYLNGEFKIVGLLPRARRQPILIESTDGRKKKFKMSADMVRGLMALESKGLVETGARKEL